MPMAATPACRASIGWPVSGRHLMRSMSLYLMRRWWRSWSSKSASSRCVGRSPLSSSQAVSSKQLSRASVSTAMPRYSSRARLPSMKLTADSATGTSARPGRNSISLMAFPPRLCGVYPSAEPGGSLALLCQVGCTRANRRRAAGFIPAVWMAFGPNGGDEPRRSPQPLFRHEPWRPPNSRTTEPGRRIPLPAAVPDLTMQRSVPD